jgi:CRP/FNR family cyclic AMP-dependent transcriptional regulator
MRLKKNAKVDLIANVPLFAGCSKTELSEIAAITDELDLPEGATLIREEERGREFLVVIDGTVKVTQKGRTVNELGPGSWVGEISLIADVPRTATVVATSPVRLLVITDRAFQQLIRRTPAIASKVLQSVGERLHQSSL